MNIKNIPSIQNVSLYPFTLEVTFFIHLLPLINYAYSIYSWWNHIVFCVCVWLLSIMYIKSIPLILSIINLINFNTVYYSIVCHNVSILRLINIWGFFSLWLLWIRLLWTFLYMTFQWYMHLFLLGICLGVWLLDHSVNIYVALVDNGKQFFKVDAPV